MHVVGNTYNHKKLSPLTIDTDNSEEAIAIRSATITIDQFIHLWKNVQNEVLDRSEAMVLIRKCLHLTESDSCDEVLSFGTFTSIMVCIC